MNIEKNPSTLTPADIPTEKPKARTKIPRTADRRANVKRDKKVLIRLRELLFIVVRPSKMLRY